jgi:hypothetical protein
MAHTYNPSYGESEIRRVTVVGHPGQIVLETLISKITKAKWTGGVAQEVEHLLCKCGRLSSNPSPQKKSGDVTAFLFF